MIERISLENVLLADDQSVPPLLEPLVAAARRGYDLLPYVRSVVEQFAFDHFTYGVSMTLHPDQHGTAHAYWTAPDAWLGVYTRKGLVECDPRVFLTCKSAIPLIWDQSNVRGLSRNADEFLDLAKSFGIASGVSFMIHGPYDGHAAFMFDSHHEINDEIRLQAITRNLPDIYMFGCYFHELFLMPVIRQRREQARRANMSDRERECLHLAANGMTTRDIADKLKITSRTVQFHFGRICVKLAAANRQEAIAVAVRERLLTTGVEGSPQTTVSTPGKARSPSSALTRSAATTRAAPPPTAPPRAA